MCENKEAEVHAIRRDLFRHLFTHEVFQTPAVKISGYQRKSLRLSCCPLFQTTSASGSTYGSRIYLINIKLKGQQDKTAATTNEKTFNQANDGCNNLCCNVDDNIMPKGDMGFQLSQRTIVWRLLVSHSCLNNRRRRLLVFYELASRELYVDIPRGWQIFFQWFIQCKQQYSLVGCAR